MCIPFRVLNWRVTYRLLTDVRWWSTVRVFFVQGWFDTDMMSVKHTKYNDLAYIRSFETPYEPHFRHAFRHSWLKGKNRKWYFPCNWCMAHWSWIWKWLLDFVLTSGFLACMYYLSKNLPWTHGTTCNKFTIPCAPWPSAKIYTRCKHGFKQIKSFLFSQACQHEHWTRTPGNKRMVNSKHAWFLFTLIHLVIRGLV